MDCVVAAATQKAVVPGSGWSRRGCAIVIVRVVKRRTRSAQVNRQNHIVEIVVAKTVKILEAQLDRAVGVLNQTRRMDETVTVQACIAAVTRRVKGSLRASDTHPDNRACGCKICVAIANTCHGIGGQHRHIADGSRTGVDRIGKDLIAESCVGQIYGDRHRLQSAGDPVTMDQIISRAAFNSIIPCAGINGVRPAAREDEIVIGSSSRVDGIAVVDHVAFGITGVGRVDQIVARGPLDHAIPASSAGFRIRCHSLSLHLSSPGLDQPGIQARLSGQPDSRTAKASVNPDCSQTHRIARQIGQKRASNSICGSGVRADRQRVTPTKLGSVRISPVSVPAACRTHQDFGLNPGYFSSSPHHSQSIARRTRPESPQMPGWKHAYFSSISGHKAKKLPKIWPAFRPEHSLYPRNSPAADQPCCHSGNSRKPRFIDTFPQQAGNPAPRIQLHNHPQSGFPEMRLFPEIQKSD